jgi:hypothetical protein
MKQDKCKGTTRQGSRCKNYAMENSEYCWGNKVLKKKGRYKNAMIKIAMVMLPVAISLAVAYYWQMKTERRIDEISPPLQHYERKVRAKLIQEYPLGYVLLWYNKKGGTSTTLVRTDSTCPLLIYPNSMEVTKGTSDVIRVRPPNIVHAPTRGEVEGIECEFPRIIGKPLSIGMSLSGLQMWFEILADDPEKLICLIGFRKQVP